MLTTFAPSYYSAFLLVFAAVAAGWAFTKKRNQLPYPPGPRRDPFIGHLRSMPLLEEQADVFHGWAKIYGSSNSYIQVYLTESHSLIQAM